MLSWKKCTAIVQGMMSRSKIIIGDLNAQVGRERESF